MIRLTYISTARPGTDAAVADAILAVSRANNRRAGVTGLLLFDGRRFLQALEGDAIAIDKIYARIKVDPRHRACVELGRAQITAPAFAGWDMAFRRLTAVAGGATLADTVDRLVAQVPDPNTRALFSSFARIERPAAA